MSEELIYNVAVEGQQSLDKLEKKVKETGKTVNKTTSYMSQLRKEQREMRGEMIKNAQGTEAYNRALRRGAEITGQINDANAKMKMGIMDLGQTSKNVTTAITGFAGGFQVVQASMQLFGIENEDAIRSIQKLQQTMAIIQGMAAFAQSIGDVQDLVANFRAESDLAKGAIGELSQVQDSAAKSTSNLGKESAVLGSNLAGNAAVADKVADGNADMVKSIEDLGDGIDSLNKREMLEKFVRDSNKAEEVVKKLQDEIEVLDNIIEGSAKDSPDLQYYINKRAELTEELEKAGDVYEALDEKLNDFDETYKDLTKSIDKTNKAQGGFVKSIGKSLLTMGAFLAAIALISLAISKLIEFMNSIPDTVKIKMEVDSVAMNNLAKDMEKVRIFADRYHRAIKANNKEAIDGLEKIASKEYGLDKQRLKSIADSKEGWRIAFKEYLENAEAVYYNAELSRMKSSLEIDLKIAEARQRIIQELYDDASEKSLNAPVALLEKATYDVAKYGHQLHKVNKEIYKTKKEMEIIAKLDYKETNFEPEKITGEGDNKTSPGKADPLSDKKPDDAGELLRIKALRERNAVTRGLSNEELEIMAEFGRKKDVLQDDSEIRYTEHIIRVAKARDKDLGNAKEVLEENLSIIENEYRNQLAFQNNQLAEQTTFHNNEIKALETLNKEKLDIENQYAKNIEERSKLDAVNDKARIAQIDLMIQKNREAYASNTKSIEGSKEKITAYQDEIKEIEASLAITDQAPEKIAQLKEELDRLNMAIAENSAFLTDSFAQNTNAMLNQANLYVDGIGEAFRGMENLTQGFMDAKDNNLARDKNNLELSQKYREADAEQQEQMMYELELANYESKKKTFEANKNFQMGAVVAQGAANQMDIIKAWLDPKTGGPLSPANIAVAAAATAANLATTVGSIAQIRSTTLEKPVPPNSGAGGANTGVGVALNPNKTALTSKEENLNMMYQSGKSDKSENVVRVSDINKVQNKVSVREKNSSY